ncbi:MAG: ribosome maturation factor [Spirochaetaceae bacterium]|nr:ribosome maturation factor [Spirochaetaceae bacterium]
MDYISLEKTPYYAECRPLVEGLGFSLVDLQVFKQAGQLQVKVVITGPEHIGIADCSKVHRTLLTRLEALMQSQDVYMEVSSPGTGRKIKNGAEFPFFIGRYISVWDTRKTDWVSGKLCRADENEVILEVTSPEQQIPESLTVPLSCVAKAKLYNI